MQTVDGTSIDITAAGELLISGEKFSIRIHLDWCDLNQVIRMAETAKQYARNADGERVFDDMFYHKTVTPARAIRADHMQEIHQMVASGDRIKAVKKIREITGANLLASKNFMESFDLLAR